MDVHNSPDPFSGYKQGVGMRLVYDVLIDEHVFSILQHIFMYTENSYKPPKNKLNNKNMLASFPCPIPSF